jgi:hypothetical protein
MIFLNYICIRNNKNNNPRKELENMLVGNLHTKP